MNCSFCASASPPATLHPAAAATATKAKLLRRMRPPSRGLWVFVALAYPSPHYRPPGGGANIASAARDHVKIPVLTAREYFHIFGNMEPNTIVAALAALAQETRLEVYRLLVQAGPAGLPAGSIGAKLSLPLPTLSFHLAQLKHAGLVAARRQSRSIIYAANYGAMNSLIAYLTENC